MVTLKIAFAQTASGLELAVALLKSNQGARLAGMLYHIGHVVICFRQPMKHGFGVQCLKFFCCLPEHCGPQSVALNALATVSRAWR